jgi:hypothetical protein
LISTEPPKGDIPTPHGIRFFTTIMLIISHKGMELDFNPISNRTEMSLELKQTWTFLNRPSSLYTDSFIMLSGMLVAYSFVGRLQRGQNIKVLKEIAARYFRIVPPMAALIIFGTFLLPILSNGPQWNMLITNQSQLCKVTWWRNFFMIHNWFGFENICMTHTHHVGTDFELFLCAPFIIMFLHKHPRKASATIFLLALASTIARFYITYKRQMTVYVLFGLELVKVYFTLFFQDLSLFFFSVANLYEVANYMYILPPYRFTVYAIGIALGYILRTHKGRQLTPTQLNLGWFIAITGLIATMLGCSVMSVFNYEYDIIHASLYSSIAPIPWCFFFAWTIYTAQLGYRNSMKILL